MMALFAFWSCMDPEHTYKSEGDTISDHMSSFSTSTSLT